MTDRAAELRRRLATPPVAAELIDADAVARLLAMSPSWVRRMAREGRIPHLRLPVGDGTRSAVRFDAAEIADWRDRHRHPASG